MGPLLINTLWRSYATKLTGPQMTLMARGLPKKEQIIGVQDIIVVASGKGGVGKSTVAANFACSMARLGKRVGLLDGDIFGPTIPLLMNVHGEPVVNDRNLMIPPQNYNVKCLSMGMLTPVETSVIWRGPLVMSAIQRLLKGADWGLLDVLIIDTPPGTGDVHLSLSQHAPITGVILVTTPHTAAVQVTLKGARMYEKLNVPIFGVVENMRYTICENCNQRLEFFKDSRIKSLPRKLISLPLDSQIAECNESGVPVVVKYPNSKYSNLFNQLAGEITKILNEQSCKQTNSK
ncbi:iron-sulfur protein NUBPL-like [Drosophila teissieri]|uniref:iron-sulfur protein NUBPL-like n=1 Tax=Drosophila teissieri TaxID=7243 RepID=UPI001CBA0C2A|nr:iron-sulfur protein NUBPL-like [Drosophila teissieri]XP_043643696.1 iron-sulfur protein NUBPL-like [Drosophila teissieri]